MHAEATHPGASSSACVSEPLSENGSGRAAKRIAAEEKPNNTHIHKEDRDWDADTVQEMRYLVRVYFDGDTVFCVPACVVQLCALLAAFSLLVSDLPSGLLCFRHDGRTAARCRSEALRLPAAVAYASRALIIAVYTSCPTSPAARSSSLLEDAWLFACSRPFRAACWRQHRHEKHRKRAK